MNMAISGAIAAAWLLSVGLVTPAAAQSQPAGVTSGPAAGTAVAPSDVAKGDASARKAGAAVNQDKTGSGAPGVPAKTGSEGGQPPKS